MTAVYSSAAKDAHHNATVSYLGAGGKLVIGTAGMGTVLATLTLENTAGTTSGGVLTFSNFPKSAAAVAGGVAAAARVRKADNTDVITGLTVGLAGSGADIILDNTTIVASQIVTVNSATIG